MTCVKIHPVGVLPATLSTIGIDAGLGGASPRGQGFSTFKDEGGNVQRSQMTCPGHMAIGSSKCIQTLSVSFNPHGAGGNVTGHPDLISDI